LGVSGQETVAQAARAVLLAAEPRAKVKAARAANRAWGAGRLAPAFDVPMPDRPARPDRPELLPANRMPKRGRAGSERARIALLHALAHIEFGAIDLAFDIVGRFGTEFPPRFVTDWFSVGADEAIHFALLDRRLRALGSHYGALPAHAGLWEAAEETAVNALARLAIVPMVLEARGLDVTPATVARLEAAGDTRSAAILNRIYTDEIRHVGHGTSWFVETAESRGLDPVNHWHELVRKHFRGELKPPFNNSARGQAGLSRDFHERLAAERQV
jgi:uncharacterized ferritin-like protein (DUF455 family)